MKSTGSEYYRIKELRNEKAKEHDEYNEKLNQYKKEKIEPLQKQIEQIKADNPHLEQLDDFTLSNMRYQLIEKQAKEQLEKERKQRRAIERSYSTGGFKIS